MPLSEITSEPSVQRIGIIVGRDAVGDGLLKLPFLRALRASYPTAKVHWITAQGPTAYADILKGLVSTLIDSIDTMPDWLPTRSHPAGLAKKTAPYFDILIDTRNRWRDALLARKLPHGVFIAPAFRYLLSEKRPPLFAPRPRHMIDRMLQQLELVAGEHPNVTGRLPVPEKTLAIGRELLPDGLVYIGFAPGAGNKEKIWPLDRFIEVALAQATQGHVPVFLLGPEEADWQHELQISVPTAKFPLQEYEAWALSDANGIERTLAVATCLDLAVTNDNGTSHMLAAVDCPLVSLFGPTSPSKFAPRVSSRCVIAAQKYGATSMAAIPVSAVSEGVEEVLKSMKRREPLNRP